LIVKKFQYTSVKKIYLIKKLRQILLLEDISDPNNLGRIARISFGFNVDLIIIIKDKPIEITSAIERSSTGLISLIPVMHVKSIKDLFPILRCLKINVWGSSIKGFDNIRHISIKRPLIIVFGNEHLGITYKTLKCCDKIISIPTKHSINVADAIAIFLYEIFRYQKNIEL
jgi:23S rRNA (guanosine2251-2'-O)-methyltransferase